jgi:hypothetical protein
MRFQIARHLSQFAFLRLSKRFSTIVSLNASISRQSHSGLFQSFCVLNIPGFRIVHYFDQFASLRLWRTFAKVVSQDVGIFWQSRSHLFLHFLVFSKLLTIVRSRIVRAFHRFASLRLSRALVPVVSWDAEIF